MGQQVERVCDDSEGYHKNHDYPSFRVEEGERAVFIFPFPGNPVRMFIE